MHRARDVALDTRLVGDMCLWRAGKTTRAIREAAGDRGDGVGPVEVQGGVFAIGTGLAEGVFSCCWRGAGAAALEFLGWWVWFRGGSTVGWEVDVCLGGFAGEDVEGGVDGDFEVSALGWVALVDLGETENDLLSELA